MSSGVSIDQLLSDSAHSDVLRSLFVSVLSQMVPVSLLRGGREGQLYWNSAVAAGVSLFRQSSDYVPWVHEF